MNTHTDPVVATALITVHASVHSNSGASATTARVKKVKQPNLFSAGTNKDSQYFTSSWEDNVRAIILVGAD